MAKNETVSTERLLRQLARRLDEMKTATDLLPLIWMQQDEMMKLLRQLAGVPRKRAARGRSGTPPP